MKETKDKVKLISRRDFLKRLGITAAGMSAAPMFFSDTMAVPSNVLDKIGQGNGEESWVNTVCGQCPGGCGIMVRLIDGMPVYIKGNPNFPVNWGGVCPMAHTSMEALFNPDRLKAPQAQETGPRGKGDFKPLEWNAALSGLTGRIQGLIKKGEGHRIAMINGDPSPLTGQLAQYWMEAVGSANYFQDDRLADIENATGPLLSQGINETPAYDLLNSKYILNFGSNFLEEGKSPVYYQHIFGRLHSGSRESQATIVHIDSRLSLTGAGSDRWVPIRPGACAALALGIAHVMITDELYDKDFIENHGFGFEPFKDDKGVRHGGFKAMVREKYFPAKVAEITGVPAETIIRLAEEFGTQKPAAAIGDDGSKYTANGGFTQWAIYCLNALAGNIQERGGVYFSPLTPRLSFPEVSRDAATQASFSIPKVGSGAANVPLLGGLSAEHFFEAVANGNPGLIDTLVIIEANPFYHSRQKEMLSRALEKIGNVVYIGAMTDETAAYANLLLPTHSFLEKTDISGPITGLPFSHIGLRQEAVAPLFDTRQAGDILLQTGKTLRGDPVFPWKDYKELVRRRIEAIYKSGLGSIISESVDTEWDKYLKDRGWKFQQYESFDSFYKLLVKNGGWWHPADPVRSVRDLYHTPSEKFEFYSSVLNRRGQNEQKSMPHFEVPAEKGFPGKFPLILTVSQLLTNRDGKGASQPSMMEMVGIQWSRHWKSWLEINPETAAANGLKDRGRARLESANGSAEVEVRVFPGILPGVVHIHLGLGHRSYGRFGTGIGVNAADLLDPAFDSLTPTPALNGTRVKVSPLNS
jgi:anaerobic selenocysteine-containing dehydrogenase